jgi:transketolase C-terminal domain/subunit
MVKEKPLHMIIGTEDHYIKPGEYNYLVEQYGLAPQQIKDKINAVINKL